jgi:hypothetical protein
MYMYKINDWISKKSDDDIYYKYMNYIGVSLVESNHSTPPFD